MDGLISAIRFLTVLPVPFRKAAAFVPKDTVQFFPLTGLGIGLILALLDMLWSHFFGPLLAGVLDTVTLICITGALHIDGLADSGDGLFSHKPAKKMLEIMRDSRIGSMGMATVMAVMLVKIGALASIETHRFIVLLLVPAFARMGLVFAMVHLPYLRKEDGLAGPFFVKTPPILFVVSMILLIVAACFLGYQGIFIVLGFFSSTVLIILFYAQRMGGVTGDMLGAMIEVQEALLLLLAAVVIW